MNVFRKLSPSEHVKILVSIFCNSTLTLMSGVIFINFFICE